MISSNYLLRSVTVANILIIQLYQIIIHSIQIIIYSIQIQQNYYTFITNTTYYYINKLLYIQYKYNKLLYIKYITNETNIF